VASLVATGLTIPALGWLSLAGRMTRSAAALAAVAGLLSPAVPYAVDPAHVPARPAHLFGVITSTQPALAALAALAGLVILGQRLQFHEWAGITIVALANALATQRAVTPAPWARRMRRTMHTALLDVAVVEALDHWVSEDKDG
jgi:inner membrane transporter RhtA